MNVRPAPTPHMEQKVGLEMTLEQTIHLQLGVIQKQGESLRYELLGSFAEGETQHGRLPRVELLTVNFEARVKSLEDDRIRWKAYAAAAAAIGGAAGSIIGALAGIASHALGR